LLPGDPLQGLGQDHPRDLHSGDHVAEGIQVVAAFDVEERVVAFADAADFLVQTPGQSVEPTLACFDLW
jgi:hypothetical protein